MKNAVYLYMINAGTGRPAKTALTTPVITAQQLIDRVISEPVYRNQKYSVI